MGGKAAIIYVLGFGFILGYVIMNLTSTANRAQTNMSDYAAATESHNLALAGANVGLARFYEDTSWRGTVTQNLSDAFHGAFTYTIMNGMDGRPMLRSISYVRGPNGTIRDSIEVTFGANAKQSFSLFAWLSNFEGNVFWITGDTVWGRVHSNSMMHMSGSPVFMEKMTTSKNMDPKWGKGGNKAIFKNGFETGVAKIDFPTDLTELFAASTAGGRNYAGDVEVKLSGGTLGNGDGYALVYQGGIQIDSIAMNDVSFNGVIGGNGRISVSGTLDGKLSIASSKDVYIVDDIFYENRDMKSSDDVLGLIAETNVMVADNAANSSSCYIDASVFARDGSFIVENWSKGSPRGELHLLGSIVHEERGPVGTFKGGGILKTGYSKRYHYDTRLSDPMFRPPSYPGFNTRTHAIAGWWESVHIPEFN
ncbi:MAG: hypothetical protein WBG80_04255 [Bacteroidota bacterium]